MGYVPPNVIQIKPRILHSLCSPLQAVIHILSKMNFVSKVPFLSIGRRHVGSHFRPEWKPGHVEPIPAILLWSFRPRLLHGCSYIRWTLSFSLPRLENLQRWRILRLYCPYCFPEMSCFFSLSAWAELLEKQFIRSVISSQLAWYVCASFIFSKCSAVWIPDFIVEQSPIFSNQEIIQL